MGWIVALIVALAACEAEPPAAAKRSDVQASQVPLSCDVFLFRGCPFVACVRTDVTGTLAVTQLGECVPR